MRWKLVHSINLDVNVCDILGTMKSTLTIFKSLTNLTYTKFNELCGLIVDLSFYHWLISQKIFASRGVAIGLGAKLLLGGLRFPSTTSHISKFLIYDALHSLIFPFLRICLLFNTFHVACPLMAFIWTRTSSFFNATLYASS
jgi:hypothetical protein